MTGMVSYVDSFLKLSCATDILNVVSPIARASKEISEAYTMLKALRKIIYPGDSYTYRVLDLCAGNGLLGVSIVHMFNYEHVTSIDTRKLPKRDWNKVRNFSYFIMDIRTLHRVDVENKVIVANHPCQLAFDIANIFCKYNAKALVLMPCCDRQQIKPRPQYVMKKYGKYGTWCMDLYDIIRDYGIKHDENIDITISEDSNCLSPKNIVITAIRR